jgi:hypothetical protein
MDVISKIEQAIAGLVEGHLFSKKAIDPELIVFILKKAITAKKRDLFGKIVVPNQIDITVLASWLNEWSPLLPRIKDYLKRELLAWMLENGYEPFGTMVLDIDTGVLDEKAFDVEVTYTRSAELILAESLETVLATLKNEDTGRLIAICDERAIIGWSKECRARIDAPSVSGQHACISSIRGKVYIEDLGSTNGTRVNREKIVRKKELRDGDRVVFGNTAWIVLLPG